jgi:hypothetical protein
VWVKDGLGEWGKAAKASTSARFGKLVSKNDGFC